MSQIKQNNRQMIAMPHRGIVLPVVLIMLVVMTTAVMFMMKRSTVDEQLAGNVRTIVTTETAANYALRFCELWLWASPPGILIDPPGSRPVPPRTIVAPAAANNAAWQAVDWNVEANTLDLTGFVGIDIAQAQCLVEDASAELSLVSNYDNGNGNFGVDPGWRKYRISVEVRGLADATALSPIARAQSEIRMYVN